MSVEAVPLPVFHSRSRTGSHSSSGTQQISNLLTMLHHLKSPSLKDKHRSQQPTAGEQQPKAQPAAQKKSAVKTVLRKLNPRRTKVEPSGKTKQPKE